MATLLQMSVSGALMAVAVLLVRLVALRRLPKRLFVVLWLLVALRLLVPVWIPSPTSAFNLLSANSASVADVGSDADGTPGGREDATKSEKQEASDAAATPRTGTQAAAQTEPATSSATPPDAAAADAVAVRPRHVVLAAWGVGAACCGTVFIVSYTRQRHRFSDALPVGDPDGRKLSDQMVASAGLRRRVAVRQSDRIAAPLTYGIARPVVLMPSGFAWDDGTAARYVVAHELVHVRRFDGVLKLVLAVAACVHWFNPLAWTMYVLANRDIELSCDEAVVRLYGLSSRGAYARTLLAMGERESGLAPLLQSGFGKTALEERIGAIMRTERTSLAAAAASIALAVAIPAALATSAVEGPTATPGTEPALETSAGSGVAPVSSSASPYFATFGGTSSLSDANPARPDDLLAAYSDEEWGMLTDFLKEACGTFAPVGIDTATAEEIAALGTGYPSAGKLTVAEFRQAALEAFGSSEGRALIDKLAADTDLAAYVQGVTYLSTADATPALDDDVATATLAYHLLLPLVSDDWDGHAIEGTVPLSDGGSVAYRMTVQVSDADLVAANEYAYTAAWVEQSLQHAVAGTGADRSDAALDSEGLAQAASALADRRTPCYGLTVELSLASPDGGQGSSRDQDGATVVYSLATGPVSSAWAQTDAAYRSAGESHAYALAAQRLFSRYEPFGLTLSTVVIADYVSTDTYDGIVRGADGAEYPMSIGQSACLVSFDGTPVARVYDPACNDVVSSWLGLVGVVPDSVDVVVERGEDGSVSGVRVAEAGEVDELLQGDGAH